MIVKTIGRGQDNNIVVNDDKVSRTHLQMVQDDSGNISVVDVGSTNGTFVNGIRITGETRLKAGDELRIGDTSLPWQNYFNESIPSTPPISSTSSTPVPQTPAPKRNPTWLFIVGGVLLLMLICGGIMLYYHAKKDRIEVELEKKEQYSNAIAADREAAAAAAENEAAQRKAAEARSVKEQQRADSLRQVAFKADIIAKAAKTEKDKMEEKLQNEQNEKGKEVGARLKAEKKQGEAEARERKANTDRDAAIEKARQASLNAENAEKKAKLTEEFFSQLNKANKEGKLKEVCETLKIDTKQYKKDEEQYNRIVGKFKNAKDNDARESIINSIKTALSKKKEPSKKTAETSAPKPVKTDSTQVEKKE